MFTFSVTFQAAFQVCLINFDKENKREAGEGAGVYTVCCYNKHSIVYDPHCLYPMHKHVLM